MRLRLWSILCCVLMLGVPGPAMAQTPGSTPTVTPAHAGSTASGDWPQFRNDPSHSGYNAGEHLLSPSNVGALDNAWQGATGGQITSSPAVADGVVYIGSSDNRLYAFSVSCGSGWADCTPLWTALTGGAVNSSPAVADGVVYVGSNDRKLYAFKVGCATDGGTCTPLWTGLTDGPIDSSPTVADGVVYVGSGDGKLYAFQVGCSSGGGTCTPLWTGATGNRIVESSPAVADGVVYIGSWDTYLYAFNVGCATGGNACLPVWKGKTGAIIWKSSPAVAGGVVYVGSADTKLYAFEVGCATGGATCTPEWTAATTGAIKSSPAVAGGTVYVGSDDSFLYAYAVGCKTGGGSCTPVWKGETDDFIESSAAVANGVVYIGSSDGSVYAFAVGCATGNHKCSPLWASRPSNSILSSPAVANGMVFAGSVNGSLYAFAPNVGHLVLSPSEATIVAGGSQAYTATAYDADGNSVGDVTATTTFTISDGGTCTGASCTSTMAGDHTVTGTSTDMTGTALLTVSAGSLDHLVLSPDPSVVAAGVPQAYTSGGVDAYGNDVGDMTALTAFAISPDGSCAGASCTATHAGPHTVTGTALDGRTGSASLTVTAGSLDHLVLAPDPASIAAGGSQSYTATGFDAYGNSLGDVTAGTTSRSHPTAPAPAPRAAPRCPAPHHHRHRRPGKPAPRRPTVTPAALDHLVLAPATATIAAGGSQAYTATGYDAFNNSRGDLTAATTFTIRPDGSCTGASCTATRSGPHTVTGTSAGKTGTASLAVTDATPPTGCGKPSVSLATGVAVGGTAKVHVTWPAGSDTASPPVTYQLSRSTNGGTWTAVSLADATKTAADVALAPGTSSYRFEVRCLDRAGNATPWYVGSSFTLSLLQETATAIAYGGAWTRAALSGASGGYVRYTGTATRSATLTSTGRSFGLVTTAGPSRGIVKVYVHGVLKATLDLYATSTGAARLAWQTTFTASASHKVKLVVTGTKNAKSSSARIDLDAFVVLR